MKKCLTLNLTVFALFMQALLANAKNNVPPAMYGFRESITQLQPYLHSESKFSEEKNRKKIEAQLLNLSNLAQSLKHHKRLKTSGFSIPAQIMQTHLKQTYQEYKNGSYQYSWRMLRSGLNGCSHCHNQIEKGKVPKWTFTGSELSKDPLELAEFWFIMRDYDRALGFYHSVLARTQMGEKNNYRIQLALDRILTITLKIRRSPTTALEIFETLNKTKSLPYAASLKAKQWEADLKRLSKLKAPDPYTGSAKDLNQFAEDTIGTIYPFFGSKQRIKPSMEYISGLLYEFINSQPKKSSPQILYWLGMINLEISHDLFFSVGEEFLKDCIRKFPNSETAKNKCYVSLENYWVDSFTGSSGTHLPDAYKAELKLFKRLLK